jgi:predicted ATPase/DNA-binding SARP family transcriptional activator
MTVGSATLRVRLLGGARFFAASAEESFGADKRHQLLAYLASQGDWVSRDRLAYLFWPDTTTQGAKQNLRRLLGRVQALPWLRGLEVERARLRWRVETDVARFREALRQGDYEAALASYGGRFLHGLDSYDECEFATWLALEREHLHALWREAAIEQARRLAASEAYEAAAGLLERVLEQDGLDEEVLSRYLELALQGGGRRAALAAYRMFVKRLRRELGLRPSAATEQLATRLEQGEKRPALPALPTPETSFVGRDVELSEIANLLAKPSCRLLTLLGPGGVGKTRIALEAATELAGHYADGVAFVPLEALTNPQELPTAIAAALELALQGREGPLAQVASSIGNKQMLIVLDNVEHLLKGAPLVAELSARCPALQLLITSRERLKLPGEWTLPLGGLAFPGADVALEDALAYDAVALFVERAQRVKPAFMLDASDLAHLLQICRLVEGFPLGLELAAAWVRALPCRDIVDELQKDVDFLSCGHELDARHGSMRAAFEHSWQLLTPQEQVALRRLAVFRGGFDKEAAAAVAGANIALLAALLDKSLLRMATERRYEIHPLLQQFAREKLLAEGGEAARARTRHGEYFLVLAERAEPDLQGAGQAAWLARLDEDYQNLCSALDYLHEQEDAASTLRLAGALGRYWWIRGHYRSGRAYLERALSHPRAKARAAARAKALTGLGLLAWGEADYPAAQGLWEESLAICQALGDEEGAAHATHKLGTLAHERGDYPRAKALYEQVLERVQREGDDISAASVFVPLGSLALEQGALGAAQEHYERALALYRKHADKLGTANALVGLGLVALRQGESVRAQRYYEECLAIARALGDKGRIGFALRGLGIITLGQGAFEAAQRYFSESFALSQETGDRRARGYSLQGLGLVAFETGRRGEAQAHLEEALALQRVLGDEQGTAASLHALGRLALERGEVVVAQTLLSEGLQLLAKLENSLGTAYLLEGFAEVAAARAAFEQALRLWGAAARLREELGVALSPLESARRDEALASIRAHLTPAAAQAAWQAGSAQLEEVLASALQGL